MATINISDLKPVGTDLFMDSESFMDDLTNNELGGVMGGRTTLVVRFLFVSTGACAITIATVSLAYVTYEAYQKYNN